MKKALMFATVASMIDLFNMDNIKILKNIGYEVHVAANFTEGNVTSKKRIQEFKNELNELEVKFFDIEIPRNLSNFTSLYRAFAKTKKIRDEEKYDLVHCHTPIGAALARIVFKKSKARIIYTAHGFHFLKGGPIYNWFIYYPVEKFLSRYTDDLITINSEDYKISHKFNAKNNHYVPGVGIDIQKYVNNDDDKKSCYIMKKLKVSKDDFIIVSVGEINKNKNHELVIRALATIKNRKIHYIIAGQGVLTQKLQLLAKKLDVEKQVHFLGYQKNIKELLQIANIFIFPSFREGLSVSLMEAMSLGLPIIASKIRGNTDLVDEDRGGYLIKPTDYKELSIRILELLENKDLRERMGNYNRVKITQYSKDEVNLKIKKIYNLSQSSEKI